MLLAVHHKKPQFINRKDENTQRKQEHKINLPFTYLAIGQIPITHFFLCVLCAFAVQMLFLGSFGKPQQMQI